MRLAIFLVAALAAGGLALSTPATASAADVSAYGAHVQLADYGCYNGYYGSYYSGYPGYSYGYRWGAPVYRPYYRSYGYTPYVNRGYYGRYPGFYYGSPRLSFRYGW